MKLGILTACVILAAVQQAAASANRSDFNGDGRGDLTVYSQKTGIWTTQGLGSRQWGLPGDIRCQEIMTATRSPIRPSSGLRRASGHPGPGNDPGPAGDIPVPGDYDMDGKFDAAVYRTLSGTGI